MGTTTNFAIPYPELTDPPDGAGQMKTLAQRVDVCLVTVRNTLLTQVRQAVATQSIPALTWTPILFDTEDIDTANMWVIAQKSRLTASIAGWYRLSGGTGYGTNATGARRNSTWGINGTNINQAASFTAVPTSGQAGVVASNVLVNLAVGQYVELMAHHDASAAVSTGIGSTLQCWASAEWLAP